MPIHSLGHSSLEIDDFLAFLREAGIERLVDVRRYPSSRRHQHFNRAPLQAALDRHGIAYRHVEALGGFRELTPESRHRALEGDDRQGYADHMDGEEFRTAVMKLATWAERPLALLCAEARPEHCHRLLLCDALVDRGHEVLHLLPGEAPRAHLASESARLTGDGPVYDRGLLPF